MRHGGKLDREGRDYWVKPLIDEIAAIERVNFSDGVFVSGHLKAKSPNSAYRLTDAFKRLLVSVETKIILLKAWKNTLEMSDQTG